jgi:hypothetical protein
MKGADANTQDTRPGLTTHPLLRVAGVLPTQYRQVTAAPVEAT